MEEVLAADEEAEPEEEAAPAPATPPAKRGRPAAPKTPPNTKAGLSLCTYLSFKSADGNPCDNFQGAMYIQLSEHNPSSSCNDPAEGQLEPHAVMLWVARLISRLCLPLTGGCICRAKARLQQSRCRRWLERPRQRRALWERRPAATPPRLQARPSQASAATQPSAAGTVHPVFSRQCHNVSERVIKTVLSALTENH